MFKRHARPSDFAQREPSVLFELRLRRPGCDIELVQPRRHLRSVFQDDGFIRRFKTLTL